MVRKFYFEQMPKLSNSNAFNIDSSIGSAIWNWLGLTMRKVIGSGDDRTKVTVDTLNSEEKVKKALTYGRILGISSPNLAIFQMKKLTCPKILYFISIRPINLLKIVKKVHYTDIFILAQIMPLAQQPKDIESYDLMITK